MTSLKSFHCYPIIVSLSVSVSHGLYRVYWWRHWNLFTVILSLSPYLSQCLMVYIQCIGDVTEIFSLLSYQCLPICLSVSWFIYSVLVTSLKYFHCYPIIVSLSVSVSHGLYRVYLWRHWNLFTVILSLSPYLSQCLMVYIECICDVTEIFSLLSYHCLPICLSVSWFI